jgi:hypothetical protein
VFEFIACAPRIVLVASRAEKGGFLLFASGQPARP